MNDLPQVVILAGGLGTRLRSAVSGRPKCLVPISGKPFLEYLILKLKRDGFREFILSIGYLGNVVRDYFGDGSKLGVAITYSQEDVPLGTAGAIRLTEPLIYGDTLVAANGDSLVDLDARSLVEHHRTNLASATIAVIEVADASRYGTVELCAVGKVTRFLEKKGTHEPGLINAGVYVFRRQALSMIPDGRAVSLEKETLPALLADKERVLGYRPQKAKVKVEVEKDPSTLTSTSTFFVDIGTPEDLLRLQNDPKELLRVVYEDKSEGPEAHAPGPETHACAPE